MDERMKSGVRIDIPFEGDIRFHPVGEVKERGKQNPLELADINKIIKDLPIKKITLFEGIGVLRYEGST
jgi:hypothetical protein